MFTLIVAHTHTDAPRSCNPPRSRRGFKCLFVHVFGSIGCTQDILLLSPPSPRPQRLLDAAGLLLQAHLSRRQVRAAPAAVYSHGGIVSHSAHTKSPQTEKKSAFHALLQPESPQFEQLSDHASDPQELVLLALLQGHQSSRRLLRVLAIGEDAPHSLLRLHVARFLKEFHERVLVDVLKYVALGLLPMRRVELVAVDGRADPAAFVGRVRGHDVVLCPVGWTDLDVRDSGSVWLQLCVGELSGAHCFHSECSVAEAERIYRAVGRFPALGLTLPLVTSAVVKRT